MSPSEEAELLARCRQGEPGAWDALFAEHYAAAGRFIVQLAPDFNREDVEEICQDTFLTVIKSLSSFQGNARFQPGSSESPPTKPKITGKNSAPPNAEAAKSRSPWEPAIAKMGRRSIPPPTPRART